MLTDTNFLNAGNPPWPPPEEMERITLYRETGGYLRANTTKFLKTGCDCCATISRPRLKSSSTGQGGCQPCLPIFCLASNRRWRRRRGQ